MVVGRNSWKFRLRLLMPWISHGSLERCFLISGKRNIYGRYSDISTSVAKY